MFLSDLSFFSPLSFPSLFPPSLLLLLLLLLRRRRRRRRLLLLLVQISARATATATAIAIAKNVRRFGPARPPSLPPSLPSLALLKSLSIPLSLTNTKS